MVSAPEPSACGTVILISCLYQEAAYDGSGPSKPSASEQFLPWVVPKVQLSGLVRTP